MHESQLGMLKVVILVQALAGGVTQLQALLLPIPTDAVVQARFHAGQDANQPLANAVALRDAAGDLFLALPAVVHVSHRTVCLSGVGDRALANLLRDFLRIAREVLEQHAARLEESVHPPHVGQPAERSSQTNPIKTR
jgi:hypothetical protein